MNVFGLDLSQSHQRRDENVVQLFIKVFVHIGVALHRLNVCQSVDFENEPVEGCEN